MTRVVADRDARVAVAVVAALSRSVSWKAYCSGFLGKQPICHTWRQSTKGIDSMTFATNDVLTLIILVLVALVIWLMT
ncbi:MULTISPECIES: hypothetical protein [Roseobacteraceae]|uniref:hypothetical protein n=1 Tax=Roseobacteraceae TaxID=2854170 RepID=UPI0012FDD368|nr:MULTISPECIES: hypothetical protein [Roseobacteraceae]